MVVPTSKWPYIGLGLVFILLVVAISVAAVQIGNARGDAETARQAIEDERAARAPVEQRAAELEASLAEMSARLVSDTVGHGQEVADLQDEADAASDSAATITAQLEEHLADDPEGLALSREREAKHVVEVVALTRQRDVARADVTMLWAWRDTATVLLKSRADIITSQAKEIVQLDFEAAATKRIMNPPFALKLWRGKEEFLVGLVSGWAAFGR